MLRRYINLISLVFILGVLIGCSSGDGGSTTSADDTDPPPDSGDTGTDPDASDPPPIDPDLSRPPNILMIIADDLGLDASSSYTVGTELPATPTLDTLAADGLVFDNAWVNPVCSPTRATILTGRYGIRTGVLWPGDEISLAETSLQSFIDTNVPNTYDQAVIGKWHLAGPSNGGNDNPNLMGVAHFAGVGERQLSDYFNWTLVENGLASNNLDYATTAFVDLTIDWIADQQGPWFAWLAFNAPHTPFHLPPLGLHDRDTLSADQAAIDADPLPYYLAMIEAMDQELGRLLASFSAETRANTVIIYLGDNGTPRQVIQGHVPSHGKGSVYEGGVAVPLIVSGRGVTRIGERESALVSGVDLFATIAALAGTGTEEIYDSKSFVELFSAAAAGPREYAYAEARDDTTDDWAIRNDRYKLIQRLSSGQELYDLEADPFEQDNLLVNGIDASESIILAELQAQADLIRQ